MSEDSLSDILQEISFSRQIEIIKEGLKAPPDSGEYRYAKWLLLRMVVPSASSLGFMVMALLVVILMPAGANRAPAPDVTFEVTVVEPEKAKTEDVKPEEDKEKPPEVEPPPDLDMVDPDRPPGEVINPDLPPGPVSPITTPGPATEYSSNPDASPDDKTAGVGGDLDTPLVPFAAVMTRSPVVLKGLYGNRTKGGRLNALRAYGGGGGGGGGGSGTENAVLRALRWLKKYQETDGSWDARSGGGPGDSYPATPAMTGLAILTYLAHGETPTSEEFGPTVERGIRWLVEQQLKDGHFPKSDGHDYCQPIAAYALSEAFGMTQVPMVKDAAKKAIDVIIKGQHACGLWNYNCDGADRNDTSYSGWCAQAITAAKMAGLDNDGLDTAYQRAAAGFKFNFRNGVWVYESALAGGSGHLNGVGVLCMQLLGAGKEPEVRAGMEWLNQNATCDWQNKWGPCPIYYWYYTTQAKFHVGGEVWKAWNKQFSLQVTKNQVVVKGGGSDGKDIGYWTGLDDICKNYVYNTTLCTLMLEVYYRYLPTFKPEGEERPAEDKGTQGSGVDVKVNI